MLRWSQRARADLKAVYDYIANDSPFNAKAVAREIHRRVAELPSTPHIGRRVPELNDADIRELHVPSWRVIYQLRGEDIYIVTLVHRRQEPTAATLRG